MNSNNEVKLQNQPKKQKNKPKKRLLANIAKLQRS